MGLQDKIGENEGIDSDLTAGLDVVSYTTAETDVDSAEEKSDAQLLAEGNVEVTTDEIVITPNSAFNPAEKKEGEEKGEGEGKKEGDDKGGEKTPDPKADSKTTPDKDESDKDKSDKPDKDKSEKVDPAKVDPAKADPDKDEPAKIIKKADPDKSPADKKLPAGEDDPKADEDISDYGKRVQKRIGKEVKKTRAEESKRLEAESRNKTLADEITTLKVENATFKASQKKTELEAAKPNADDFSTDADYHEALGSWSAKMEIHNNEVLKQTPTATAAQDDSTKAATDADLTKAQDPPETPASKVMKAGAEKYDDFETVVTNEDVPITKEIFDIVNDSEYKIDILYTLGKNIEETKRIAAIKAPLTLAREIGLIESKFITPEVTLHTPEQDSELLETTTKPKGKADPTPTSNADVSNADVPIKPIGGGGTITMDRNDMGIADYNKSRGFDRTGMPLKKSA